MWIKKMLALVVVSLFVSVVLAEDHTGAEVVAIVGDKKITQAEIDALTQRIPKAFRRAFQKKALESAIDTEVFYHMAVKDGLDKTPGFIARLEKEKRRILANYFIDMNIKDKIIITAEEVRTYYEKHRDEFFQQEMVRPAHILVRTKEEAETIKARLEKGEAFDKLARENAGNPSAKTGGDLGWKKKGMMSKAFEDAVFALRKGEISDIVEAPTGYHIIRVVDKKEGGIKSLEDARPVIENRLRAAKITSLKERFRQESGVRIVGEGYKNK